MITLDPNVGGNGTVYAIVAAFGGVVGGVRIAAPALMDIIREWRRPDNDDYQEALRLRKLLGRVYRDITGTSAYSELSDSTRADLEAEFQ